MSSNNSEEHIQTLLRADNKKALEEVYLQFRNEFLNYAKRFEVSDFDALDIYQDAVIILHQQFAVSKLELKKGSLKTYLFGIAKNLIFQKLREKKKTIRVATETDDYTEIQFEEEIPSKKHIILAKRLEEISESCKQLLKLFYYRNLTIDEIVVLTDYKDANTVRSHKSRCLKHLKSIIKVK